MSFIEKLINDFVSGIPLTRPQYDSPHMRSITKSFLMSMKSEKDFFIELEKTDIRSLKYSNRVELLNFLITTLVNKIEKEDVSDINYNNMIDLVLHKWASPLDPDDISGVIGDLFSNISCSDQTLNIIRILYPDIIPIEIVESQLENSNGVGINLIIQRLSKVYGYVFKSQDMAYLLDRAQMNSTPETLEWLKRKFESTSEIADMPEWVNIKPTETPDILNYDTWRKLDSPSQNTDLEIPDFDVILSEYDIKKKDGEVLNRELMDQILETAKSVTQKLKLEDFPTDPDRFFGPLNRRPTNCVSGVISDGCRMLTCRCRDFDQDEDIESDLSDPSLWFNNKCDACEFKILNISYALRYPVIGGGWAGCYCSVDCVRKLQPRDSSEMGELLVDTTYGIIEAKGIVDRLQLLELPKEQTQQKEETIEFSISESSASQPNGISKKPDMVFPKLMYVLPSSEE